MVLRFVRPVLLPTEPFHLFLVKADQGGQTDNRALEYFIKGSLLPKGPEVPSACPGVICRIEKDMKISTYNLSFCFLLEICFLQKKTKQKFRDPAEVLGSGAEVDYLEQFGTSTVKELAWRKQFCT